MSKKILIVEDESIIGLDIASKLERNGYDVIGLAVDDEEVRKILERVVPDLILMDINLKGTVDGIDLVMEIHEKRLIPVVYITSYSDSATISRSMETTPYGYIIKPFTTQTLLVTVSLSFIRMELEKSISEKTALITGVLDNISDGIAVVDESGDIALVNKALCRIVECSGDPCGHNVKEMLPGYENSSVPYMMDVPSRHMTKRVLAAVCGFMKGSIVTLTDLTEVETFKTALDKTENSFATVFKKKVVPSVIASYPDGVIYDVNDGFEKLYGTDESVVGKNIESIIGIKTKKIIIDTLKDSDYFAIQHAVQQKNDGNEFFTDIMGNKIFLRDGVYFLVDIIDVSEKIRLEKREEELKIKMLHTNKMAALGTLVSGVAHELNNPNNFIMFNTTLLMDYFNDIIALLDSLQEKGMDLKIGNLDYSEAKTDITQLLAGTVNGSERIRDIVLDLKGFARQGTPVEMEVIAPAIMVESAVRMLHHNIAKTTDYFKTEIADNLPKVKVNRQKLEQVLINIMMNSLEAMTAKNQTLTVRCFAESGNVVIEVEDTGMGISEGDLQRITEPFFTTKQNSGGTGLGLSIAYSIIKDHNGVLDIISELGKGTVVRITLPAES